MITPQTDAHNLTPEDKVGPVYDNLAAYYGDLEWRPSTDPLSELILTILSQHTSDLNRDRAFKAMRARFPTWEEVRDAPTDELADSIRSGGLSNVKAPRIQQVLRDISDERTELNLDFLMETPVEDAKKWLARFKGVGPKTAACVLMFACGMPVLPVDTHVYRVSQRIGLIGPRTNADRAHTELEAIVEPDKRYSFHIYLITHGRQICKAPRPLCEKCVVSRWCNYYAETSGQRLLPPNAPGEAS
ncbi:MAG: endonuclease III [Chloroflexota bacterium]